MTKAAVKPRPPQRSTGRRLALWVIALITPIVGVLGGAEAVFRLAVLPDAARTWGRQAAEADAACDSRKPATAEEILQFRNSPRYHEKIGFRQPPGWAETLPAPGGGAWSVFINAEGARVGNAEDQARSLQQAHIHVYGDSFAAGAEVDHDLTWAYLLEQRSGRTVANFGIPGGAPDQALQYLEANLAAGFRPRQVIIEMTPENVLRMASLYRCFLSPDGAQKAWSKPRYVARDGRWVWSSHPAADLGPDKVAGFSAAVAPRDFWGQRLMASHDVLHARIGAVGLAHYLINRDMLETPRDLLLADPQSRRALMAVLDGLAALAKTYKFRAYFVLLPGSAGDLSASRAGRAEDADFAAFLVRETRTRNIAFINAVQVLGAKTDVLGPAYERYATTPAGGAASADGNRAIADVIGAVVLPRR